MRMDKLTTKFQQALADAQSLAVGRDHQYVFGHRAGLGVGLVTPIADPVGKVQGGGTGALILSHDLHIGGVGRRLLQVVILV